MGALPQEKGKEYRSCKDLLYAWILVYSYKLNGRNQISIFALLSVELNLS